MTIQRVIPAGAGVGDTLTSAQLNAIDVNTTNALDKRGGQTDTMGSVVSLQGAGRIALSRATGANVDTTYLVSGGNTLIQVTSAVTAARTYTLSNTNAQDGDQLAIFCDPTFVTFEVTIKSAAAVTLFVLGNLATSDGTYALFTWSSVTSAWVLEGSSAASRIRSQTFTAGGTWTCPAGVTSVTLTGCGGGGGGANGTASGASTAAASNCGGGGGGGATLFEVTVAVTPGTGYTVTIGGGGSAGADGADTTFAALATFSGAAGGVAGTIATTTGSGNTNVVPGGSSSRNLAAYPTTQITYTNAAPLSGILPLSPGQGGYGTTKDITQGTHTEFSAAVRNGATSAFGGFAGGAGGANGATSGTFVGGGGGGGGGGGPFAAGGAAGAGGNGNSAGVGSAGAAGTAAAANSGAGGGGGGAPGQGSGGEGTFGAGGAGGSGKLIVTWVK